VVWIAAISAIGWACTWAPLQPSGAPVAVLGAEGDGCEALGTTTARTTARLWLFSRNPTKVRAELETLARNEAGAMGGDAIIAAGAQGDGEQRFRVLRCRGAASP
jgi:hypothetical protein